MRFSKLVMILTLLGGLALLGGMVWHVGLSGLLESFRAMGFWLVPYLLLRTVSTLLHAVGWAACFPGPRLPCRFWQLVLVMRAGNAINQVTFTADIGGEIVRVLLLKPFIPQEQAMAAVVIDKASATMAHMLYLAFGMLYLTQSLPLPLALHVSMALTIGLIIAGVGCYIVLQRYALLSKSVGWMTLQGWWPSRLQRFREPITRLDAQFATYYMGHPWRFVGSLIGHGAAHVFDIVKTYWLLRFLLGAEAPGWPEAAMVAIAVAALDQMLFFVPGRLGTLEGSRFAVLSALGVSQIYGLAFGLIARVEHLVWSGLGLLAYAYCTRFFPADATRSSTPVSSASP
jgi:uncharacterized protein (TIRG00374 family)